MILGVDVLDKVSDSGAVTVLVIIPTSTTSTTTILLNLGVTTLATGTYYIAMLQVKLQFVSSSILRRKT